MSHARRTIVAAGAAFATGLAGLTLVRPGTAAQARRPAGDGGPYTAKTPTSRGLGGAVSSVDPEASKIGLERARAGRQRGRRSLATAAALGVTEPYSSGIGGGGYFVHYDARSGKVSTLDGRETAPRRCRTTRSSTRRRASPTTSPRSWSPAASPSVRRGRWPPGTPH